MGQYGCGVSAFVEKLWPESGTRLSKPDTLRVAATKYLLCAPNYRPEADGLRIPELNATAVGEFMI